MSWYLETITAPCADWRRKAEMRQNSLTKPPGSLGLLEDIAVMFSAFQGTVSPCIARPAIVIMAADHGVAAENVSAFPQAVTAEMVKNFSAGGAAITVLARQLGATFQVVNLGTVAALPALPAVVDRRIAAGCGNICIEPAMTAAQLEAALAAGREAVATVLADGADLLVGGEMGIANTTSAACLAARLLDKQPLQIVGAGTGIDADRLQHKTAVVERALACHPSAEPLEVLRCLGGFEIAALAGAYIAAAGQRLPVLIDGYIATAAALAAVAINAGCRPWLVASHCSAEAAHRLMLDALQLSPLLDLSLRLGEGSGAAVTVPLIQAACRLQSEMASFDSAGISGQL
ncbi:MAG TPA: nicotinate-nucleotide--dimethylbenzimidazole phosphoribosyltransferase [Pseudomonadales bacterium]